MSKRFKANTHGKVIGQYPDEDGRFMAWGWRFPDGALSMSPSFTGFKPNLWHSERRAREDMGLWDGEPVPLVPAE